MTIVLNNTIYGCTIGVHLTLTNSADQAVPLINYNNLLNSSESSFYSGGQQNISIPFNWWGTAETQTINQSIHDKKVDPELEELILRLSFFCKNPQAPSIPIINPLPSIPPLNTPSPSISPSPTIEPSTSVLEFPTWTVLPLVTAVTLLIAFAIRRKNVP